MCRFSVMDQFCYSTVLYVMFYLVLKQISGGYINFNHVFNPPYFLYNELIMIFCNYYASKFYSVGI